MRTATIIVRNLLGIIFLTFGLNLFLHFIPIPSSPDGPARDFKTALTVSHYFYVVGALELVGGLLLLTGRFVPLGLTLLGPIIVNILCVHVFLDRSGLPFAIVLSAFALFLLWRCRENFAGLLKDCRVTSVSPRHSVASEATAINP